MPAKQTGERLFEYHYSAIGSPPSLVSVPTHFFKIVVAVEEDHILQFACFVVPNQEFASTKGKPKRRLEDFLVPWTAIEAVTGLHFFPTLTGALEWKEHANQLTQDIVTRQKALSGGNKQQPLLLTDGSVPVPTGKKRWGFGPSGSKSTKLNHFCSNGGCS